jgi:hypothetical protein
VIKLLYNETERSSDNGKTNEKESRRSIQCESGIRGGQGGTDPCSYLTLRGVAQEVSERLTKIFLKDESGRRPVYGDTEKFQTDPHWRDLILFFEYFHGDKGTGIGASHQTGWTGCIASVVCK